MTDLYIIKLGGSVITEKRKGKFSVRKAVLRRIAGEIIRARKRKKFRLIVVHGAGPFGHRMVKRYGIDNGIKSMRHLEGLAKTHLMCEQLNREVVRESLNAGLIAVHVQPSAVIVQENKKIVGFNLKPIEMLWKMSSETIPVMYGSMVMDLKLNGSVVSGDAIVPYLARKLKAKRVFLGTDVKGICDAEPRKNKRARLIERIDGENLAEVLQMVSFSTAVDVTRGMRGKLERLKEIAKGIPTVVFDLNGRDNLYKLLTGKRIKCTEVLF